MRKAVFGAMLMVSLLGIVSHYLSNKSLKTPVRTDNLLSQSVVKPRSLGQSPVKSSMGVSNEAESVSFDWHQLLVTQMPPPKLPREKVEEYLQQKRRSATSLLSAYHALKDTNYLAEAALNFPDDPQVQSSVLSKNLFPSERRQWIDRFRASSPNNALPAYLSAREYFKDGQDDLAVRELTEAQHKPQFQDFSIESRINEEELNMSAGRTAMESRFSSSGWADDLLEDLSSLKGVAQEISRLQKQYSSTGDVEASVGLTQIGLQLSDHLAADSGSQFVISQLVSWSIESIMLRDLDGDANYDFLGVATPNETLAKIKDQRNSLRAANQILNEARPGMTEAELFSLTERERLYGEVKGMLWFQNNHSH